VIVDLVLSLLLTIVEPVLSALPTASVDLGNTDQAFGTRLGFLDRLIPILGPLKFVSTILGLLAVLFVAKAAVWLYRLLPGKGS
jgi:hypothetical protein